MCLLAACLAISACNKGEQSATKGGGKKGGKKGGDFGPVPVVAGKVVKKDIPVQIKAVGNVEPYSTVSIRPQVGGQLIEVFISDGDYVSKGQKLFQIDDRPLLGQIAQAEATLARNRAMLAQATANLARDTANEKYALGQATRYAALFTQGVVSKDDRDRFASNADALVQLLQADKAAVDSAKAQIQADEANIASIKLQLSFTTIYSPLDGRSGNVTVKAGNIVNANQTELMQVTQVQPIYVTFSVPENRLSEVQRSAARMKLPVQAASQDGLTPPENGVLTFVDNTVDATTGTIRLKGTFQNAARSLWPGEFVNITLRLATQPNAMVVPSQAVQAGQDGSYVYVVNENRTVEARPVVPGIRLENEIVIDEGLSEGETVVTEGQLRLAPGSRVTLPGEGRRGEPGGGQGGAPGGTPGGTKGAPEGSQPAGDGDRKKAPPQS